MTLPKFLGRTFSVRRRLLSLVVIAMFALQPFVYVSDPASAAPGGNISLTTLGTTISEPFDSLASSGTAANTTLPTSWDFVETGSSANTTYTASTGSSTGGDTYSFGTTTTDRAFGELSSNNNVTTLGAKFTNNTGSTITSLDISYTGEQWRSGDTANVPDVLDFEYSTNATSLTTGTWTAVNQLDFTSVQTTAAAGMLDGNLAANRANRAHSITSLSIANGTTFWIRWVATNIANSDDSLAIDDFFLTPQGGAAVDNPPTVTTTTPSDNAVNVQANTNITITFSEAVTASASSFTINCSQSGAHAFTLSGGPTTYTLDPTTDFTQGEVCTVTVVAAQVTDQDGTPDQMAADYVFDFTVVNTGPVAIYEIQGSGTSSPRAGQTVTTTGIVTGRRSFGSSNNGFYIQDPSGDANENTSDAVLVFTGSTVPTVNIGDSVQVTGTVTEFEPADTDEPNGVNPPDPKTTTELVGPLTINVISTGNTLPAARTQAIFDPAAISRGAELEKYEHMRVSVASLTVSQPTNNFGEFWGVVTGQPRPFREPGIERGDPVPAADEGPFAGTAPPNVPIFDGNFERIMVNSGAALNGSTRRTQVQVTTGTVVTGIVGQLDFAFENYQIVLDADVAPGISGGFTAAVPVPTPVAGEFTVASANLENFTNNAGRLNKASLAVRNMMHTPDVVGVIEVLDQATLTALANKINADANNPSAVNYQAFLSETSGTQDLGFLVNTARVTPVGTPTAQFVGKTFTYAGGSPETLHDRPPYILIVDVPQTGTSDLLRVTVILNHTKSLIGVDDPTPRGQGGTEGGRNREKRRLQAEDIADLIEARKNENLIMMGDLNAFDFNDGLGDVVGTMKGTPAPANQVVEPSTDRWTYQLFNSLGLLPADQQYSLLFEGNAQALDHLLVNQKMRARQSRFAYARYNADFPASFAADTTRPERLADHDSAVSYFLTGAAQAAGTVLISEFRFNGPNGTADEFIELYNNTNAPIDLTGWTIVAPSGTGGGGVLTGLNQVLGARRHYLVAPSNYSVSEYPAGAFTTALPDTSYSGGAFLDNGGAQLLDANGNVIDSVGFSSATGIGFREGAGLSPAGGLAPGAGDQYSFVRKMTSGLPQDTNNNAADFVLVSTTGTVGATVAILGAPGPENTQSPVQNNANIKATLIDATVSSGAPPNRVRSAAGANPQNAAYGTLSIRRKFINATQQPVTRLRFRVVDITTLNSPGYAPNNGQADMRVITSTGTTTTPGNIEVRGTRLEEPPTQNLGGGLNSTLTLDLSEPLPGGESVNVQLLLGVQQEGNFRFFVNVEADFSQNAQTLTKTGRTGKASTKP